MLNYTYRGGLERFFNLLSDLFRDLDGWSNILYYYLLSPLVLVSLVLALVGLDLRG